jgi:hypothetical protein
MIPKFTHSNLFIISRPKFRSYLPLDEELKNTAVIPQAKPGDVESIVREELEAGKSTVVIDEVVSR